MDENAVIEIICTRLMSLGCEIIQRRTTKEQGIDIIARNSRSGHEFVVEAKGGTSARIGSARHGRDYSASQVFDRAAKGVFTCIRLRAENPNRSTQHVILAVPETDMFRRYLDPVLPQLIEAGIQVWFAPHQEQPRAKRASP